MMRPKHKPREVRPLRHPPRQYVSPPRPPCSAKEVEELEGDVEQLEVRVQNEADQLAEVEENYTKLRNEVQDSDDALRKEQRVTAAVCADMEREYKEAEATGMSDNEELDRILLSKLSEIETLREELRDLNLKRHAEAEMIQKSERDFECDLEIAMDGLSEAVEACSSKFRAMSELMAKGRELHRLEEQIARDTNWMVTDAKVVE